MQIQENLAHLKEDIELRGLSANTLKSYTSYVRKFLEFTNKPVETLDEKDVRNYLNLPALDKISIYKHSQLIQCSYAVFLCGDTEPHDELFTAATLQET
jgi:site-specific recombinase XerD